MALLIDIMSHMSCMSVVMLLLLCLQVTVAFRSIGGAGWMRRSSLEMHNVRIINQKKQTDVTISIPSGAIILDSAEQQGVSIPYSCRAGSCSSCVGKLRKGSVDQSGQIFLTDKQMEDGYVLTCAATASADCEIEVDVEDMFYNENPDMVQ